MELDWITKGIILMVGAIILVFIGLSESQFKLDLIIKTIIIGIIFFLIGYFVYAYAKNNYKNRTKQKLDKSR